MAEENIEFNFEKIYVKDISFESPQKADIFTKELAPKITIQLNIGHEVVNQEQGLYEVVLHITAQATMDKDTSIFLVEMQQAGLFTIKGVSEEELDAALQINCPNILLPFARETISELVQKGGFPQFLLSPVNFEALYEQKLAASTKQATQ